MLVLFVTVTHAVPESVVAVPMQELMEGMEGDSVEGGGVGALEKLSNKLSAFLNECRGIQVL